MKSRIAHGDVLEVLRKQKANSFDSCLTDPPYGLSFMGKEWDHGVPGVDVWKEVLRVLKPGAMMLAFGGTRTFHRLACAIEDAGFEIRDCCMWLYGSGFPKSHDISKAIDKAAGANREVVGKKKRSQVASEGWDRPWKHRAMESSRSTVAEFNITAPSTPEAQTWNGYGTALKPAWEPILVCMKPLDGTFAENALRHGVAGLNVDGCRIGTADDLTAHSQYADRANTFNASAGNRTRIQQPSGRWPANLILDEHSARLVDEMSGELKSGTSPKVRRSNTSVSGWKLRYANEATESESRPANSGGASRFFYVAKASRRERGEGNTHPTVKPIALAEYLAKLILPPKRETPRRLLVPFSGSGSECIGGKRAGFEYVLGIEISEEYKAIAERRLAA
jgi:DNA modification methylase